MKRIEDIEEFEDIDTYYEISKIVDEVFQDRVEAHKHLVTANKEIERLNNIMNKFEEWLNTVPNYFMDTRSNNTGVYIQKGMQQMIDMSKNKLQELKGSDKE